MWHWTLTHFSFVCCVSQLLFLYFFIFHKLIWWVEEGLFTSYFSRKEISFIVSSICCPSPSFQLLPPDHFAVLINTPSSSLPSWFSTIVCVCVCSTDEERERDSTEMIDSTRLGPLLSRITRLFASWASSSSSFFSLLFFFLFMPERAPPLLFNEASTIRERVCVCYTESRS